MTLQSSAAFLCGGLKILTKPLNMVQGFPKVNFPYGISCYKKVRPFSFVHQKQAVGTYTFGLLVNLHMPQLHEDSTEFMSSTFILTFKNRASYI